MARSNPGTEKGIHEANVTPLIDVSLVLVVILLVATPLAFQSSFAVSSASTSARHAAQKADDDRVEMTVHADGDVTVNRRRLGAALLGPALEDALRGSASRLVVVRCEDQVPHGTFVHAIDEARAHGAARIAVVGR
jgi:biopolymer transport protein ExbD